MKIIIFIIPSLFFILSGVFYSGRGTFLIAGYNTASKEEKSEINEKALCRFMGKFTFMMGIIQLIVPISQILELDNFRIISILTNILFIAFVIGGVIYMNIGDRFKNN